MIWRGRILLITQRVWRALSTTRWRSGWRWTTTGRCARVRRPMSSAPRSTRRSRRSVGGGGSSGEISSEISRGGCSARTDARLGARGVVEARGEDRDEFLGGHPAAGGARGDADDLAHVAREHTRGAVAQAAGDFLEGLLGIAGVGVGPKQSRAAAEGGGGAARGAARG